MATMELIDVNFVSKMMDYAFKMMIRQAAPATSRFSRWVCRENCLRFSGHGSEHDHSKHVNLQKRDGRGDIRLWGGRSAVGFWPWREVSYMYEQPSCVG